MTAREARMRVSRVLLIIASIFALLLAFHEFSQHPPRALTDKLIWAAFMIGFALNATYIVLSSPGVVSAGKSRLRTLIGFDAKEKN